MRKGVAPARLLLSCVRAAAARECRGDILYVMDRELCIANVSYIHHNRVDLRARAPALRLAPRPRFVTARSAAITCALAATGTGLCPFLLRGTAASASRR